MPAQNQIPRYETRTMLDMVTFQEPKPSMFRTTFFKGGEEFFQTKKVEWDEVREGAGMARYVADGLEVEATEREGFITRELETPRFQEKRVLALDSLINRSPGENIYSQRTPAERAREQWQKDIAFCMDAVDRRIEQQCAQMMVTGRVDIVGKGINTYVDYELPLKLTLSGADRWGQTGVSPFKYLAQWCKKLRERNYRPSFALMELSVADVLMNDGDYKKMLDNQRMETGLIAPGPINDIYADAQFFGQIKWPGIGHLDLYTYDGTYKNDSNKVTPYLDPGRFMLLSDQATQNRMLYGAESVVDENTEDVVTVEGRYIPEIYTDRRAKTRTVFVTSRAMPAPCQCDSWWTVKVL